MSAIWYRCYYEWCLISFVLFLFGSQFLLVQLGRSDISHHRRRLVVKSPVEALKETGPDIQRMVMGHTPQNRINSALGGRAWRIDVGASRGVMGGTPEVLEIIHMGGENDEDIVSILKEDGTRVAAKDRETVENVLF